MRARRIASIFAAVLVGCGGDGSSSSADSSGQVDDAGTGASTGGSSGGGSSSVGSSSASTTASSSATSATASESSGPATSADSGDSGGPSGPATEENLKVALFGDQGSGADPKAVYQLALDEGADLILLMGDFDYEDDPALFHAEMVEVLGDSFPVFGVIGNHDVAAWSGYRDVLQTRLDAIPGATCTGGDIGGMSSCKFKGLHFVLSGIGTLGTDAEQEQFLEQSLQEDDSIWSICVWHKNQTDMQAGDKGNEVGWNVFQICQDNGGFVAMGHEHSYARTLTLTDVGNEAAGHGAVGNPETIDVALGSTFSVCTGLGGSSIRDYDPSRHDDDTWWASIYTNNLYMKNGMDIASFQANYGALFIEFHVDGDPTKANAYFKNIDGEITDEFTIVKN